MTTNKSSRTVFLVLIFAAWVISIGASAADNKALTFEDLMKFKTIHDAVISEDGGWIAYQLKPDRGDSDVVVRSTTGDTEYRVERGKKPAITSDSKWVAVGVSPSFEELEKSKNGNGKDKPQDGMALLRTSDGTVTSIDDVEKFVFSEDGRWLAYKRYAEKEDEEDKGEDDDDNEDEKKKDHVGTTLILRELSSGRDIEIPLVTEFAFHEPGQFLAYAVAGPNGTENGLFLRRLTETGEPVEALSKDNDGRYTSLSWAEDKSLLAFVAAVDDDEGTPGPAEVRLWNGQLQTAVTSSQVGRDWFVPSKNNLEFSRDGARLFFGVKPEGEDEEGVEEDEAEEEAFDPYDRDDILDTREVDVWHWNDPLIIPHQKEQWKNEKDRTYQAVYHVGSKEMVRLADLEMRDVEPNDSGVALGLADVPYLKQITWDGRYRDIYAVGLDDGTKTPVEERLEGRPSLSPEGRFIVYYDDRHWHLFDVARKTGRNLTKDLEVPFANEDHDYPRDVPGYGIGGWIEGDSAVLIYDKYDIWQFPTNQGAPICLTGGEGRSKEYTFRVIDLDEEQDFIGTHDVLLMTAYHQKRKNWGFYRARVGAKGVTKLLEDDKRFRFLAKAEKADRIIYTRESYRVFPDIWTADLSLGTPKKLSDVNPQIEEFAWGSAELVEWNSMDGIPLQGVVIKPGDYEEGKRYPVLVYYYRFFSQRLNEFNEPVVNHRPSFPLYASNGYIVFLPDIRFEVGRPGFSATKCLVPGVQKLVDMGIADPDAIGLHGHSWSGYQTAFVITQTDIFAAAVAGAPVSNMTSAYSGIRWGSGLARQFQYENTQSRIGGSLWEYPERYIENSPVFFADKINTPLLTMFGDEDGAVPWYQGIELYLAMRRLGKDSIFLQYRGEPHHPQKYGNKLDYAIKMKQYLDHYLKGKPAPEWMTKGIPYKGK
jgi:dipeptidyl aminopeptidase/acylaminoacyl peptidase